MEITSRTENVAGDGGPMPIYVAEPQAAGSYPVVIVFQEAFGVNGHIKKLTERFARDGYVAIAPDMYYRSGPGQAYGYEDLPKVIPILQSLYDAQTEADARLAITFAKGLKNAKADKIGCTGYCMGGTLSFMTACLNRDIKAAACYYPGGLVTRQKSIRRPVSPHEYAELLTAPLLGQFGELDQSPPPADVKEVDALLTKLGKVHDFKLYPGANHGFNCDERASYHKPSADDAWDRINNWFAKYLKA